MSASLGKPLTWQSPIKIALRVLCCVLFCCPLMVAFAQNISDKNHDQRSTKVKNDKPTNVDELVGRWLPKHCYHLGSFEQQKSLAGLPTPVRSSGRYFYSCKHGFIWELTSPIYDGLAYREAGASYKMDAKGTAQRLTGRGEKAIAKLLAGLLGGDPGALLKRFEAVQANETMLLLTPRRKQMQKHLSQVELKMEQGLPTTNIVFASGDSQSIRILDAQKYADLDLKQCIEASLSEAGCQLIYSVDQHVSQK